MDIFIWLDVNKILIFLFKKSFSQILGYTFIIGCISEVFLFFLFCKLKFKLIWITFKEVMNMWDFFYNENALKNLYQRSYIRFQFVGEVL